jgi:hypothetical protein
MSRNGSGTYSLPAGNPVVTGTTISSTWANNTMNDIAAALTDSVAADGQTPMTGNLDANNNKIVNLADPTLVQDAATKNYSDTTYLAKAANLSDVANATTSRTNISAAKSGANSDITSLTGLTTPLSQAQGGTGTTTGYYGFKNRIINGAMVIDQRNAGASVSVTTSNVFGVDRWKFDNISPSTYTVQQSSVAPTGFSFSSLVTVGTGAASAAADYVRILQLIEGFNTADLMWGTANAKAITLSFWVRSSIAGTYCVGFQNSATDYSYPINYTINSANTWEYKTITVAGPTAGTWLGATNGVGISCVWDLGSGSNWNGTNATWQNGNTWKTSSQTAFTATSGATFYITGVQLEVGSTATSFDYRPYGTELALCQRYYETIGLDGIGGLLIAGCATAASEQVNNSLVYKITKRATPTVTKVGTWNLVNAAGQPTVFGAGNDSVLLFLSSSAASQVYAQNGSGSYVTISAEL